LHTTSLRQVARLVRRQPPTKTEKPDINIIPEASYLITGGLGALGLQTAKWLVDKGAKSLVLVGRKEPSEKARQIIAQLEQLGVQVSVLLADISVAEDVANLLKQIQGSLPPLRGVIHAAGVLDDGVLQQMNWQRFIKVMAPKVQGAWHLHQLTQELPLDFFVCFSSAASVLGSTGQGNYAAANAFLDGLVHYRRSLGLPGLSINWGAWAETGMASRLASQFQSRIRSLGMGSIPPEQGLQILTQLLEESATQVTVVPIDWDRFTATLPSGMKLPILEEMECYYRQNYRQNYRQDACSTKQTEHNTFLLELKAAKQGDRTQLMKNYLQGVVAKLLGYPDPEMLDSQLGFFDLGMDSLLSLELRNLLQVQLGCAVSATLLFEYTNIEALAEYLTTEVLAEELEATIQNTDSQQTEQPSVSGEEVSDAIAQKFQQIQNLLNQGL
jgi:myxalamid-type polyketide synthase MxaE and MxaD